MRQGARVRRAKWAAGACLFAQRKEITKGARVTWDVLCATAPEKTDAADTEARAPLRPMPWLSTPADIAAKDWEAVSE
jgi:hypothetical protein